MAQRVQVVLIDDIDGGNADETVAFALDGVSYEIDLSSANAVRLRDSFARYIGHARKSAKGGNRRQRAGQRSGRSAEIRAWARAQGLPVPERGRIPADLAAKFDASH